MPFLANQFLNRDNEAIGLPSPKREGSAIDKGKLVHSERRDLRKFPKLLAAVFVALIACSAGLLAFSVIDGMQPIDRKLVALQQREHLPPLPTAGLPGAVAPEKELLQISPKTAQEINAVRPFSTDRIVAAAPLRYQISAADEERAVACLATAAIYEAGGNSSDQSAVIQVILNRARHPAFPGTVCGVVFQGSERSTGCQFSFTCDGSMSRYRPGATSWRAASSLARAMLQGHVDQRVGLSTHYHTDWVVPYWSASLDKVTSVRTHLFFKWQGYWGTPAAFKRNISANEPVIKALAGLFPSHFQGTDAETLLAEESALALQPMSPETALSAPERAAPIVEEANIRRLAIPADAGAGRWAVKAVTLCSDASVCRVVGWSDPSSEPSQITRASLLQSPPDLVFVKVARNRHQQAYWNCDKWPRASGSQCLGTAADVSRLIFAE